MPSRGSKLFLVAVLAAATYTHALVARAPSRTTTTTTRPQRRRSADATPTTAHALRAATTLAAPALTTSTAHALRVATKLATPALTMATAHALRVATTLAAPTTARALRAAAALPVLYGLMSLNEYATHRWFQHAEWNTCALRRLAERALRRLPGRPRTVPRVDGAGHVEHHAETLDDMTLKTDRRWRESRSARKLDGRMYRGTAFTWNVTAAMTVQMLPTALPVYRYALGFSLPHTLAVLLPGMLVHALVWNALHPHMHALPDVPLRHGAPSWVLAPLRDSWFFRYLYQNHEGHHVLGGTVNYNVCCPGADHLLGTYVREAVWRPEARTNYRDYHGEEVSLEQQIANAAARSRFGIAAAPFPERHQKRSGVLKTSSGSLLDAASG